MRPSVEIGQSVTPVFVEWCELQVKLDLFWTRFFEMWLSQKPLVVSPFITPTLQEFRYLPGVLDSRRLPTISAICILKLLRSLGELDDITWHKCQQAWIVVGFLLSFHVCKMPKTFTCHPIVFHPWRITKVFQWHLLAFREPTNYTNPPVVFPSFGGFPKSWGIPNAGKRETLASSCQDVSFPQCSPSSPIISTSKQKSIDRPFRHAGSSYTPKSQITYWISRKACIWNQAPFFPNQHF